MSYGNDNIARDLRLGVSIERVAMNIVTRYDDIDYSRALEIVKEIKEKGPKGISSQTQGEQVRVTGKKRDDLQETMALLKSADLDLPIQFENFRD